MVFLDSAWLSSRLWFDVFILQVASESCWSGGVWRQQWCLKLCDCTLSGNLFLLLLLCDHSLTRTCLIWPRYPTSQSILYVIMHNTWTAWECVYTSTGSFTFWVGTVTLQGKVGPHMINVYTRGEGMKLTTELSTDSRMKWPDFTSVGLRQINKKPWMHIEWPRHFFRLTIWDRKITQTKQWLTPARAALSKNRCHCNRWYFIKFSKGGSFSFVTFIDGFIRTSPQNKMWFQ